MCTSTLIFLLLTCCRSVGVIILKHDTCTFQVFKGHTGVVRCVAVDPSGQWIASGTVCDKISAASCCTHSYTRIMSVQCTCSSIKNQNDFKQSDEKNGCVHLQRNVVERQCCNS